MKKLSLLLTLLVITTITYAQDECQEIVHSITSSSHSQNLDIDSVNGSTLIYYDLCLGEELILEANASFPDNNTFYSQSLTSTEFSWAIDGVQTASGISYTSTYNTSIGYILSITSTDTMGCENTIPFNVFVRVSTVPNIDLTADPSTICPNILTVIGNDPASDVNVTIDYETGGWASTACEDEYSEETYLPDDNGTEVYSTEINLGCFGEGQTLTDVNDILSIDVNMEHSYSGDLDMFITAPNGAQVQLFSQAGGGNWFGEPLDGFDNDGIPGIGYDYGWSMNPTYSGTMAEGIASGNTTSITTPEGLTGNTLNPDSYFPVENLNALLGTELNGVWEITIIDNLGSDDGFIFSWGMSIDAAITPSHWVYDNFIVNEYWEANPTIESTSGTNLTILPTTPGIETYTYVIEDNFGCTYSEDLNITVTSPVNATTNLINNICDSISGEISLTINGGTPSYSVDWNTGAFTGQDLIGINSGVYYYTITDAIGCEFSGVETIITEIIELELDNNTQNDHCDQDIGSATVVPTNGIAPYSYNWDNGFPDNATASNLNDGEYDVWVTDSYGCVGETTVEIINIPGPIAYFDSSFDTVVYNLGLVEFLNFSSSDPITNITDYNWSFGEGTFSEEYQPSNVFDQIGIYNVELTVTDSKGCVDSYIKEIVSKEDYLFWPPTAFTPNGDNKNDQFRPLLKDFIKDSYEMYIYDRWGKLVFQTTDYSHGWDGTRIDNGIDANPDSYTYLALFNTKKNIIVKKTGSFVLLR